jgi:hydroxymethylpyrimidine pyrophosphatase-like HAD family hydrolase
MYLFYLYSISAAVGLLGGLYGLASAVLWVTLAVVALVVVLKPLSSQAEAEERLEHEEFARLVSKARDLTIGSTALAPIVIEVTHGRVSKASGIQELRELIDLAVNKK